MRRGIVLSIIVWGLVMSCAQHPEQREVIERSEDTTAETTVMPVQSQPSESNAPDISEQSPKEPETLEEPETLDITQVMENLTDELNTALKDSNMSVTRKAENLVTITLSGDAIFALSIANVTPEASREIEEIGEILIKYPQVLICVEGHTDSKGPELENLEFSEKRAGAVRKILFQYGISESRLETLAFGEKQPIASNQTMAGRQQNRRVEIKITPLPE